MRLGRFIRTRWLPARQDRLRPTTFHRYRQMTELYALPHLGRVPLRRLTVAHLQDLCALLRTNGGHDGRQLAPKTVLNAHQVLRTALGDAERQGLVARNVARMIDPPLRERRSPKTSTCTRSLSSNKTPPTKSPTSSSAPPTA